MLDRQHLSAHESRQANPVHDRDTDEDNKQSTHDVTRASAAEHRHDDDDEEQVWERVDNVGKPHEETVDPSSEVAREHSDRHPDEKDDRDRDESHDETDGRTVHQTAQHVATERVRSNEKHRDCGIDCYQLRTEGILVLHLKNSYD